jgi:hypothetical protein
VLGEDGEVSHMMMYPDGSDIGERADLTDEEPAVPAAMEMVEIDPSLYDRYEGRYELVPGFILTVTRKGDQIFTQATGQPQFEIFPSSETEFFLKVVDAQLVFEVEGDAPAIAVTLHQGGQELRGKRLEN